MNSITTKLHIIFLGLLPTISSANSVIGSWKGQYTCSQGITGLTLTITEATPNSAIAFFHFYQDESNPGVPSGCFSMQGNYNPRTGFMRLLGHEWIVQPNGYMPVDFSGTIDPLGGKFSGRVEFPGCNEFNLRKIDRVDSLSVTFCKISETPPDSNISASEIDKSLKTRNSIDLTLEFETGKYQISKPMQWQLDELGRVLSSQSYSKRKIAVYGHTDGVGNNRDNLALSQMRANSISEYLQQQFALKPTQITAKGFGFSHPKNSKIIDARENRRVEIVILE